MQYGLKYFAKARFYSSVVALYVPTLLFALYLISPATLVGSHKGQVLAYQQPAEFLGSDSNIPAKKITSGTPTRILITQADNGLAIDLPVGAGYYDDKNGWTLSEHNAQYAVLSVPPNDNQGHTLIYGHNNKYVFGYLSALRPDAGATAEVYTENGHIFSYAYDNYETLSPDDLSVFQNHGPPVLAVQTCSGSFFQYRQMFNFTLQKVDGHAI